MLGSIHPSSNHLCVCAGFDSSIFQPLVCVCVCVCVCACACVHACAESCPTPCDPMDCSLPGSSVHGIFQARILEQVAISYSWGSSQPGDQTSVSCLHWQADSLPLSHLGSPSPNRYQCLLCPRHYARQEDTLISEKKEGPQVLWHREKCH